MRILLLTNIYPSKENPRGGSFIESRIDALRKLGHDVLPVAVGPRPKGARGAVPLVYGDATVPVSMLSRGALRVRAQVRRLECVSAVRVREHVAIERVEGVMAHGMFSLAAGRVAKVIADETGIPFTTHLHGSDVNVVMPRNPEPVIEAMTVATRCYFVSRSLRERAAMLGYSASNWEVTGNGVNHEIFRADMRQSRPDAAVPGLDMLFVGNLLRVKGADRLPSILREVRKVRPDATLTIVGDGPLRAGLEKALPSGLVRFRGRLPAASVAAAMAAADVLLLPSRSEGWPTVINESYATGTPVVAAAVGGAREALLAPDRAVQEGDDFAHRFARQVLSEVSSPDPQSLIRRSRNFSWSKIVSIESEGLSST